MNHERPRGKTLVWRRIVATEENFVETSHEESWSHSPELRSCRRLRQGRGRARDWIPQIVMRSCTAEAGGGGGGDTVHWTPDTGPESDSNKPPQPTHFLDTVRHTAQPDTALWQETSSTIQLYNYTTWYYNSQATSTTFKSILSYLHSFHIMPSNGMPSSHLFLSCQSSHWPVLWQIPCHGLDQVRWMRLILSSLSGPMLCLHPPVWTGTDCGGAVSPDGTMASVLQLSSCPAVTAGTAAGE